MIPKVLFSAFRDALISGKYNMLLGAGISTDSKNGDDVVLRSGNALRMDLCKMAKVSDSTPLHRVCMVLTEEQIKTEIIKKFSNCTPGITVKHIPKYLWKKIFTFNIDDALEAAYEQATNRKQDFSAINYINPFEPETDKYITQIIHLHGWVRRHEEGLVFSYNDYASVMSGRNPWMYNLAQSIATEPFIISGSALDEIDLEYYLSCRNMNTPRRGSAASLFIDPSPDPVKEAICKKHRMILINSTLNDFFVWLNKEVPSVPDVASLLVPDAEAIFESELPKRSLLKFYSDFQLVSQTELPLQAVPSKFLYGSEPEWKDIFQHIDISRAATDNILGAVKDVQEKKASGKVNCIIVTGDPGTGKTTTAMRVAHAIASLGTPVLEICTLSKIDVGAAIECLSHLATRVLITLDDAADHIEQILEIISDPSVRDKVILLAVERSYRKPYLDLSLFNTSRKEFELLTMQPDETRQLIERYAKYGLTARTGPGKSSADLAKLLSGDPVAVAICRIMNDFKPLDRIVESMVSDSDLNDKIIFQHVALAQYCYGQGIRYSLLQSILGPKMPIGNLFKQSKPLRLAYSTVNNDFVVAQNRTIAERVLHHTANISKTGLLQIFCNISNGLASHVNRYAIRAKTPEARLAVRIFDVDKVVRPLLGDLTFEFFVSAHDAWEWNSRYWEQRALYTFDSDPITALSYAKHAVSVERHQFPLTTLGKILMLQLSPGESSNAEIFSDAFDVLSEAIHMEARLTRIAIHPYLILISGASKFLNLGGSLTSKQWADLKEFVNNARVHYRSDGAMIDVIKRLEESPGF